MPPRAGAQIAARTPQAAANEPQTTTPDGADPGEPAAARPERPALPGRGLAGLAQAAQSATRALERANGDAPGIARLEAVLNGDAALPAGETAAHAASASLTGAGARIGGTTPQLTQQPPLPAETIAIEIARHAAQGVNRFEIRLDPPELGRVDVRLDISAEGRVSAHLSFERGDTLDLAQRDARALERALADAGLEADADTLSFSLKDQGLGTHGDDAGQPAHGGRAAADDGDIEPPAAALRAYVGHISADSVDIRV